MAVSDRAAFRIDEILRQTELLQDGERNGRECFVDLDPLQVAQTPVRALERLPDRGNGAQSERSGLDRCHTV
jgi:hypothetical protein